VVRGFFNLAVGYLLVGRVGNFDLRTTAHARALGLGVFVMILLAARHLGRFNGGEMQDRPWRGTHARAVARVLALPSGCRLRPPAVPGDAGSPSPHGRGATDLLTTRVALCYESNARDRQGKVSLLLDIFVDGLCQPAG